MKNIYGDEIRIPKFSGMLLRSIREAAGLTQREAGTACGLAANAWQRYEYGEVCPSADTMMLICMVLDVMPGQLFE